MDTNVLVYARDASEPEKQGRAELWLRYLWSTRAGRLSAQILNEYYVVVTEKLKPGYPAELARADIRNFMAWAPLPIDGVVTERAWAIQDRFDLGWWDSLAVSAAQATGCAWLLTEDLSHGQDLDGLCVISPFSCEPGAILGC